MNSKFSIVIPYHADLNTVDFVKKQLNYYHFNPTPMVVILAVSGDEILKVELKQFVEKLNDFRFVILTADESDVRNIKSFLKKIFDALTRVATPYVVINGADDVVIPQAALNGVDILDNNLDAAATKGHTIGFDHESGKCFFYNDLEILDNCPIDRIKLAIKVEIRESFFYVMRRTKDLVREYENMVILSKKSKIVSNSFYYVEHFAALSLVSLGKLYVFKCPWRFCNSHRNNSRTYAENGLTRIDLGLLDKANYEWFKSVNKDMNPISYILYKFLCIRTQILNMGVTLEQVVYHIYKNYSSLINSIRILTWFILYKISILLKLPNKSPNFSNNGEDFFKTEAYSLLKKYYFSENDIKLIEAKKNFFSKQ